MARPTLMTPFMVSRWFTSPATREAIRTLPARPGVYAIYEHGALVYIGSTDNLCKRLASHWSVRGWATCDRGQVLKFSETTRGWLARERRLIQRLTPPQNQQWHPENAKPIRWRTVAGRRVLCTGREALQLESNSGAWRRI